MPLADPLSNVLSLLSARSLLSASLRTGGDWSIRFSAEGVKFNAVIQGACFLIPEASGTPIRLEAGDCFLLTNCGPYVLCSDPRLTPVEAHGVFERDADGSAKHEGGGEGFFAIGGRITLDEADASLLLDALPPILHVNGPSREAHSIRWLLTRLVDEWAAALPGGALAADHLAQLLFVEVIRVWLRSASSPAEGWLHAIGDRRVGAAMRLLHGDPAKRWRLEIWRALQACRVRISLCVSSAWRACPRSTIFCGGECGSAPRRCASERSRSPPSPSRWATSPKVHSAMPSSE